MSKKATEKKPTDEALATLMLDRQERVQRCEKIINEVLNTERVALVVSGFDLSEGRLLPKLQLIPKD
jgi:hypothetical protein